MAQPTRSGLARLLSPGFWPWRFGVAVFAPQLGLLALRRAVRLPGDELQREIEERVLLTVLSFLVLLAVVRLMEKRTLRETGLFDPTGWMRRFSIGVALGAGPIALHAAALSAAGLYAFSSPGGAGLGGAAFLGAILLLVGVDEEIRYRALAFRTLEEGVGSWLALALSGAFFGLMHATNRGATPLGVAVIAVGGVFLAACYVRSRSLWTPIGFHFAWNTTLGVVLGLPVSGAQIPSLLRARVSGDALWTGGAFGPEASVSAVVFVVGAAAFYLWRDAAGHRLLTPAWMTRWQQKLLGTPPEVVRAADR